MSSEPPSPPTAPISAAQGAEDEAAAKERAAKEKKEAANAGNAAADAVAKVLDSLGQGLTNGLSPGDPPAVIKSAAFTMSVEKAVMPDFGSGEDGGAAAEAMAVDALAGMDMGPAPDEGEEAGSGPAPPAVEADPKAMFFPVSNAVVDKLASLAANPGAAPIFIVPPGFVAGQEEVDVQLLTYKVTSRSPPPPPEEEVGMPGELEQETSSAVTAMTLRSGAPPLAPPSPPLLHTLTHPLTHTLKHLLTVIHPHILSHTLAHPHTHSHTHPHTPRPPSLRADGADIDGGDAMDDAIMFTTAMKKPSARRRRQPPP